MSTSISQFLKVLFQPGDVFEVRAPKTLDRIGADYASTVSGYFNNPEAAAREIEALDKSGRTPGIYVTLNPVNPALIARSANKLKAKAKQTSQDTDILRRRWLLLDLDPIRPAGVSSTDAELQHAADKAEQIRGHLVGLGWPEPIVAMSGNGYHLLYRVDLPTDDAGLVKAVLGVLADMFDDQAVSVDRAVFNPARISKVAGTVGRKGDDLRDVAGVEDRPHRRAELLRSPETIVGVPEAILRAMIPVAAPKPTATPARRAGGNGAFDCTPSGVRAWLEARGCHVTGERRFQDRTMLLLDRCPINPQIEADGSDIAVSVGDDGKLGYCNKHSRAAGLTWHDVRRTLEPGWSPPRERKQIHVPDAPPPDDEPPPITEDEAAYLAIDAELAAEPVAESLHSIADEFVAHLRPTWHRERKIIHLEVIGSEVRVAELCDMLYLRTDLIERARFSAECINRKAEPSTYGSALTMLMRIIRFAAAKAMSSIKDEAASPGQLIDELVRYFTTQRPVRLDSGMGSMRAWTWAVAVATGTNWQEFPGGAVFAKNVDGEQYPQIAAQGERIAAELKYPSTKALSTRLKAAGLITTRFSFRVGADNYCCWRLMTDRIGRYMGHRDHSHD